MPVLDLPTSATPLTERLWREYTRTGDVAVRNRLVVALTPLVRNLVYRKIRELPARYEVEDFVSCGLEAVIATIDRYDPSKGASLEQFAWIRVSGAIIDELRRLDWAPRSLRRFERDAAKAHDRFTSAEGRHPSRSELAGLLGVSEQRVRERQEELVAADVGSLNAVVAGADTSVERIDTLRDEDERCDPRYLAQLGQAKERFRSAFHALPVRDREVAVMLYVKNMTLREIGTELGVSESRVCQIHSSLKGRLKQQLAPDAALLTAAV